MKDDLIVTQDGTILRITINRPEAGNSVTDQMVLELTRVLNRAHETADLVLLRGSGADFCTGRAPRPATAPPLSPEAYRRRDEYDIVFSAYWAMRRASVPIVGVVRGRAMGFGLALAALCDVSFAADTATFNIPEMAHNVMPTMVMSSLFDRVSRNAIAWLTYSTDFINAERALTYGLVSTVVPEARLDADVERFCDNMINTPRPAILGLKEYLRVAPTMDAQGAIDYARSLHSMVNASSEMRSRHRKH